MKRLLCLLLVACLTGCSSTTVINSVPEGATIYLNGERVGTTPYTLSDTKIVGSSNAIMLKKEGYQDFIATFSRTEEADVGAIVGGVLVLVPFLWTMGYKPTHTYEMTPLKIETKK